MIAPNQLQSLYQGIDRLLRLDYPENTDEVSLKRHYGAHVDALEMIEAVEVLRFYFKDTEEMLGKAAYRGEKSFDFISELKEDIRSYYLEASSDKEGALRRRKYRTMVVLMLNPLISLFQNMSHADALNQYDEVLDRVIEYISTNEIETRKDDAFVVRHLIQKDIERHNRVTKVVDGILHLRRRHGSRRRKKAA